ncbi:Uncharacterised protein [Salmonella enterica subsp. enterica serovar Typhi]|nr:Uncharacterised protein [Salmonella enterica subsp. enterica serovar Typhi]
MKNAMITKLSAGQPRKEKPAVLSQLTLLDIIANGTAIRLFKETLVSLDGKTDYLAGRRAGTGATGGEQSRPARNPACLFPGDSLTCAKAISRPYDSPVHPSGLFCLLVL